MTSWRPPPANDSGARREVVMRRKDGSCLPADIGAAAFYVEREKFISIVVRDITRRKHAEEALIAHAQGLGTQQQGAGRFRLYRLRTI